MPLIEKRSLKSGAIFGIWKIEEPAEFFDGLLTLTAAESDERSRIKGRRQEEWLASRWLLHILSERLQRDEILKDQYGKPHLANSDWEISISHTHGYTAVMAGPTKLGIDIQKPVEKIARIAHKYLHPDELENIGHQKEQQFLHVYWGAKESLYKAYGRRFLDFKNDILIDPFNLEQQVTTGRVIKGDGLHFDIFFQLNQAYVLVYAINTDRRL